MSENIVSDFHQRWKMQVPNCILVANRTDRDSETRSHNNILFVPLCQLSGEFVRGSVHPQGAFVVSVVVAQGLSSTASVVVVQRLTYHGASIPWRLTPWYVRPSQTRDQTAVYTALQSRFVTTGPPRNLFGSFVNYGSSKCL